jgi:hypothetical protein
MRSIQQIGPIDYLVIGHITQDITPDGLKTGGTVSYASLTAKACGLKVGIVTTCEPTLSFPELEGVQVVAHPSPETTTFENIQIPEGRLQIIHHVAQVLDSSHIPQIWLKTPIVHLGPVAREIDPSIVRAFPNSFIGATPQGWLRYWDENGKVTLGEWPEATYVLEKLSAAVISIEDVHGDEKRIEEMMSSVRVLAVTEGFAGSHLYWNGDVRNFHPPEVDEIDPTGAGDIFAAAFFIRLQATRNPWEAARFATLLASKSVTRRGLDSVPTVDEAREALLEIIAE